MALQICGAYWFVGKNSEEVKTVTIGAQNSTKNFIMK